MRWSHTPLKVQYICLISANMAIYARLCWSITLKGIFSSLIVFHFTLYSKENRNFLCLVATSFSLAPWTKEVQLPPHSPKQHHHITQPRKTTSFHHCCKCHYPAKSLLQFIGFCQRVHLVFIVSA